MPIKEWLSLLAFSMPGLYTQSDGRSNMEFTITFVQKFLSGVYLTSPILVTICLLIIILGLVVGRYESWTKFNSIYWAFITGLTVGYGDIKPIKKISKILSIIIGVLGLMLAGIFVAVTVEATKSSFIIHVDPDIIAVIDRNIN